jgi:glycosyltransferase involved in cell wall biosynthesis
MTDQHIPASARKRRPRILVMADWYAPGFRAGGPIRSVVNFAAQLDGELDIYILTTDRDLGEETAYAGISTDIWVPYLNHQVCYLSPSQLNWKRITRIIRAIAPDHIYLNSMFSRYMTIYPLMFVRAGGTNAPVMLAPRGMLMDSALAVKPGRKKVFLTILKWAGIGRIIRFQATNENEATDIYRHFGAGTAVVRLGNLPAIPRHFIPPPEKQPGMLRMVFVGRAHPIKQLDFLLNILTGVRSRVHLTVVWTREDEIYAERCRSLAKTLPGHVTIEMHEGIPHDAVEGIIRANHIFALPTRGENFGHSIYEALAAGRPVLISDQTPWRGLSNSRAGWDFPLSRPEAFSHCIEEVAGWDQATLMEWCNGARQLARRTVEESPDRKNYITQFSSCTFLD